MQTAGKLFGLRVKEAGPRELNKASKCYANLREWNVIFDIIDFICITFTFLKKIKSV